MSQANEILNNFVSELYDISKISEDELKLWNDSYSYKGFNRDKILKQLQLKVGDPKTVQQIILICGLLGPQRASQMKLINGRIISSYGIPASGAKGTENISCQRIASATADLCAYLLKRIDCPKRLNISCPGWLQFPGAGSIKMPDDLRTQHIEFSKLFSAQIGGVFNEQIYQQMIINSYLDENLHLFDTVQVSQSSSSSSSYLAQPIKVTTTTTKRTGNIERKTPP
jgi:hypothetical protein